MKCAVFKCFLISVFLTQLGPISATASESCKCPKNPGPGGGVQCSKDQIATCDPPSGECNCTCDFVQKGKSKEEYEALILSKVLQDKVSTSDLSSPRYNGLLMNFHNSEGSTFKFQKEVGNGQSTPVRVGVPDWLKEVLTKPSGPSVGPRGLLQNCPSGGCVGSSGGIAGSADQSGTGNVSQIGNNNTQITVGRDLTPEQREEQRIIEKQITDLLNEGNDLMSRCFVAEPKPELASLAEAWAVKTHNYLASVRPSYAAMFDAATGISFSYTHVAPENANIIHFLKAKKAVLVNLLANFAVNNRGIGQISSGPNSPNVVGSGNQFNFGTGISYDFNGAKRTFVGGEMKVEVGEEFVAYQQMVSLENQGKWPELAELGETWARRNPQWLGSYVFASEAYLRQGKASEARELLEYVSKHAPAEDKHYDGARDALKQLTH